MQAAPIPSMQGNFVETLGYCKGNNILYRIHPNTYITDVNEEILDKIKLKSKKYGIRKLFLFGSTLESDSYKDLSTRHYFLRKVFL